MVGFPKDLGVFLTSDLRWYCHSSAITQKASVVFNCILRSSCHKCVSHFALMFKVYCKPILEYCFPVWFSFRSVRPVENFLRHFTRIASIKILRSSAVPSYETMLSIFGLESMERRLIFVDLCLCLSCQGDFAIFHFALVPSLLPLDTSPEGIGLGWRAF